MNSKIRPPKDGIMHKVIAYVRVSMLSENSGSHSASDTQPDRIREYADQTFGPGNYELEILSDDGLSGGYGPVRTAIEKGTRPTLKLIGDKLLTGKYDYFLIYSLSRFMRSERWLHQYYEDVIIPSDVCMISVTENTDFTTPEGRIFMAIKGTINASERRGIQSFCKDATLTTAMKGYPVGNPGFGWARQPLDQVDSDKRRGIVPVESEGRAVRMMKDRYLSGWSDQRIAGELNLRAVSKSKGSTIAWTDENVRTILSSPLHAGLVGYDGKTFKGAHFDLRYYDPEDFEKLKAARARRIRWHPSTGKQTIHLLCDLVTCARCGSRLYTSRVALKYRAYRCQEGTHQGKRTCPQMAVNAAFLEDAVVRALSCVTDIPEFKGLLMQECENLTCEEDARLDTERIVWAKKVTTLEDQLSRWSKMLLGGAIDEQQFTTTNRELLGEKREAQTRLAEVDEKLQSRSRRETNLERVKAILFDFPNTWKHLDHEERRNLLLQICDYIRVDKEGKDAIVKLKLVELPEQTIRFMSKTGYKRKPEGIGPHTLTYRQLAFLVHIDSGMGIERAGQAMQVSPSTVRWMSGAVRKQMGVHDLRECAIMARQRINELRPLLPLGASDKPKAGKVELSAKNREVLPYYVNGASITQTAAQTGLTTSVVANRFKLIKYQLGAKTRYEASIKARALGLVS